MANMHGTSIVGASKMHVVAYSMLQGSLLKKLGVGWIVLFYPFTSSLVNSILVGVQIH